MTTICMYIYKCVDVLKDCLISNIFIERRIGFIFYTIIKPIQVHITKFKDKLAQSCKPNRFITVQVIQFLTAEIVHSTKEVIQ